MDYKKLATDLLSVCEENCADCKYAGDSEFECTIAELAATAITDLLARAEAVEVRCETLEKMVKEYQEVIIPGYREQAEKAERERDAAVKVIERVRSCKDCGHYTGEWTPPCKECQDSEEHHPCFKWRGQKEE